MLRVSRCSFFALFWVGLAAFQSPGSAGDFLPAFEVEDLRRFPKLTPRSLSYSQRRHTHTLRALHILCACRRIPPRTTSAATCSIW